MDGEVGMSGSLSWDLAAKVVLGLTGALGSLIALYKWISEKHSENKKLRYEAELKALTVEIDRQQIAGMKAMAYVYEMMDSMTDREQGYCDRVIIFNGHNGGKLPAPGSPYYVSAIHSSFSESRAYERRPEVMYRKIMVDTFYINMLLECYENQRVLLETSKMPECELKNFYIAEGVCESIVFYLRTSGNSFVFGSSSTVGRPFTELEVKENQRSINLMRTSMTDITRPSPY